MWLFNVHWFQAEGEYAKSGRFWIFYVFYCYTVFFFHNSIQFNFSPVFIFSSAFVNVESKNIVASMAFGYRKYGITIRHRHKTKIIYVMRHEEKNCQSIIDDVHIQIKTLWILSAGPVEVWCCWWFHFSLNFSYRVFVTMTGQILTFPAACALLLFLFW